MKITLKGDENASPVSRAVAWFLQSGLGAEVHVTGPTGQTVCLGAYIPGHLDVSILNPLHKQVGDGVSWLRKDGRFQGDLEVEVVPMVFRVHWGQPVEDLPYKGWVPLPELQEIIRKAEQYASEGWPTDKFG